MRAARQSRMQRHLSTWVSLGFWLSLVSAGAVTPLLSKVQVQGLVVPFYFRNEPEAMAVAQVDRVFQDHQRRGFLKINLLPLTVADGVTLRIRRGDRIQESLAAASAWMVSRSATRAHELRRVTLIVEDAQGTNRLTTARARLQPNGTWQLQQATLHQAGQPPFDLASATLFTHGPQAGTLACSASGRDSAITLLPNPTTSHPQTIP